MTDDNTPAEGAQRLTHADFRRAAALIRLRAESLVDGIAAGLNEAADLNRTTPLLRCLIDGYGFLARELRTEDALIAVNESLDMCAELSEDVVSQRGAQVIVAHRDEDLDAFNAVLVAANDDGRPVDVLLSVLDIYAILLPELAAPHCLANLAQWIARIAAAENGGGEAA